MITYGTRVVYGWSKNVIKLFLLTINLTVSPLFAEKTCVIKTVYLLTARHMGIRLYQYLSLFCCTLWFKLLSLWGNCYLTIETYKVVHFLWYYSLDRKGGSLRNCYRLRSALSCKCLKTF